MTDAGERPGGVITDGLAGGVAAEIAAALKETARAVLPAATVERVGDEYVWSREGRRFAVQAGATASFRIGTEIGAAALRTPDVGGSPLGPDGRVPRVGVTAEGADEGVGHRVILPSLG